MKKFFENVFSFKLYLEGLKKIKAIGVAALICIVVPNAMIPIINIIEKNEEFNVSYESFAPFGLAMLIFAPMMVYSTFSYLNERNKSDFFHMLPQKRSCVYISFILAVITWIAGVTLVTAAVSAQLWSGGALFFGMDYYIPLDVIFNTVLYTFAASLLVSSYMALAMMLTGTVLSNLLLFAMITTAPRIIGFIYVQTLNNFVHVLDISGSLLRFFNFEYFLPLKIFDDFFKPRSSNFDSGTLIYSLIAGMFILAVAGFAYVRRKSETAGKSAPNKMLGRIYSCVLTLPLFFALTILTVMEIFGAYDYQTSIIILLSAILVVYLIFELIMTKKLKEMFKTLKSIWMPAVAALLIFFTLPVAEFAIESFEPETEDIKSITIKEPSRLDMPLVPLYDKEVDAVTFEHEEACALISAVIKANKDRSVDFWQYMQGKRFRAMYSIKIEIELVSGVRVARKLYFSSEELYVLQRIAATYAATSEAFIAYIPDDSELISLYYKDKFYYPNEPADTRAGDLWNILVNEYRSLSTDEKVEYILSSLKGGDEHITVYYNIEYGSYSSLNFYLSEEYLPLTVSYVKENIDKRN